MESREGTGSCLVRLAIFALHLGVLTERTVSLISFGRRNAPHHYELVQLAQLAELRYTSSVRYKAEGYGGMSVVRLKKPSSTNGSSVS